jgi:hypothetical protein
MPTPWFDAHQTAGDALLTRPKYMNLYLDYKGADALIALVLGNEEEKERADKALKKRAREMWNLLQENPTEIETIKKIVSEAEERDRRRKPTSAKRSENRYPLSSSSSSSSSSYNSGSEAAASAPRFERAAAASSSSVHELIKNSTEIDQDPCASCDHELSIEELKRKLHGIVQYAEKVFPVPGSKPQEKNRWCNESVAILKGQPYTRAMINGELKHSIVENLVKNAEWRLQGGMELKIEAAYDWTKGQNPTYNPNPSATGTIRPDIVIHQKGDPSSVVMVIDMKFPCPADGTPASPPRKHPHKENTHTTQAAICEEGLKPTHGVWLLSPLWGYKKDKEKENESFPLGENHDELAHKAAWAARDSVKDRIQRPPFSQTPISAAAKEYIEYLKNQFVKGILFGTTDNPFITWNAAVNSASISSSSGSSSPLFNSSTSSSAAAASSSSRSSNQLAKRKAGNTSLKTHEGADATNYWAQGGKRTMKDSASASTSSSSGSSPSLLNSSSINPSASSSSSSSHSSTLRAKRKAENAPPETSEGTETANYLAHDGKRTMKNLSK